MNAKKPARVALYLQDAHKISEGMEFSKYAEAKGFEAVWQAESRLVREATVPMAAFASVTTKLKIDLVLLIAESQSGETCGDFFYP